MFFQVSKDNSLPLHLQLLDELRHQILTGALQPHDRLPGEWELVETIGVSRATIQRAWQSAQEEGLIYRVMGKGTFVAEPRPPLEARATVGLLIPEFRSSFAMQLLTGAERVLRTRGIALQLSHTERNLDEENRLLQQMRGDGVSGVLVVPTYTDAPQRWLTRHTDYPVVFMDRPLPGANFPCVASNNYVGALQVVEHLLAQGHRRIVFLAQPNLDLWPVAERYRAYQDALMRQHLIPADPFCIGVRDEMSSFDAYTQTDDALLEPLLNLLTTPSRPTAIFAVNDWMALKALRAARMARLKVPQNLAIAGFDNMDITEHVEPPLTTVAQNGPQIGEHAARLLPLALLDGAEPVALQTLVPTRLIVRASTIAK